MSDVVVAQLEAPFLIIEAGIELLDERDDFIEDISGDLVAAGASIERHIYATIHGTIRLALSRQLDWGKHRIRPYLLITSQNVGVATVQRRWSLGVFLLTTPEQRAAQTPPVFDVTGFDKLVLFTSPHGSSFSIPAGAAPLDVVQNLLESFDQFSYIFDQQAITTTVATDRVWPIDPQTTTLNIINDLLASVGYRSLYVDRDGFFRSEPYRPPSELPPMWAYSTASGTSTVGVERTFKSDLFDTPNRWVFIVSNPGAAVVPVEGAGVYTKVNQSDGPSSIDARGGRVVTRIVQLDAADQTSLVTQGDRIAEADAEVIRRVSITAAPNPNHWHFDVASYLDNQLGLNGLYLVTDWTLPLDGSDMSIELKEV